ncbi:MAG: glycerol-3-phosphate dehydrogenase/oxidase [Thermoanaerobaculia bacterium]|nr:glycerol-3-phosphate dehydrogenase/oxidase [Thermoanaerobaculia bacterium]
MKRANHLERARNADLRGGEPFDLLVIGGGATGVGVALDAAARGFRVLLTEATDFGQGTSSRSTKLIHGGVRYLQQGNVPLVMEALRERGILRNNAPHLVSDLKFVVPNYSWWEAPFYGIGMKVYDALAGRYGFGKSRVLSHEETVERLPTIETEGLRGGVIYHDGQFDDARLLLHLLWTAFEQGAVVLNHAPVTQLLRGDDGFLRGATICDQESGESFDVEARLVINATGPFSDQVRQLDNPAAKPRIQPSQGVHVVLPRRFLPGDSAIMVPHTDDGRVLFAIPWHDRVLLGTTDTPLDDVSLEPRPQEEEIDFLLVHAARYLTRDPKRSDVLSVFAGIRPLVAEVAEGDDEEATSKISREHSIEVSPSGLLTVAGGKWTTYRKMAQDVVDLAQDLAELEPTPCATETLHIHAHHAHADRFGELELYGSDALEIRQLQRDLEGGDQRIHERLEITKAEIVWGVREEMARTLEDVLSRRTRALLFDARAAIEAAPTIAGWMAEELGHDPSWAREQVAAFTELAQGYLA